MGQTQSAPPDDAVQFRRMVLASYRGDVDAFQSVFRSDLRGLQISRATYLDIIIQEQAHIETLTDSLEREERLNGLQDEKMEFFSAVEQGRLALGDTLLHIAVRLGHTDILDFILLTDPYQNPPKTVARPDTAASTMSIPVTGRDAVATIPVVPPPLPTNTPNFKGDLPRDVTGDNCSLQLLLATVDDVHEVFGSSYREEAKVHRLMRSLRRIWPLWMFEGQQEVAALVRVLYDVRTSDPAFGGLVRVAMALAERFRVAVSRDGIRLAMSLLAECDGDLHQARQKLMKEWSVERKSQELTAVFRRWFPLYKSNGRRIDHEGEQVRVVFFDTAMMTLLQIAQDLRLFGGKGDNSQIDLPDAAALKRYDSQISRSSVLKKVSRSLAMNRRGHRSTSLLPRGPPTSRVRQRVCNSAPTQVIPDQDEDWDYSLVQTGNGNAALYALDIRTRDDKLTESVHEQKGDGSTRTIEENETHVANKHTRNAGDFTDFMDSDSSDSGNYPFEDSNSDESYEYWTNRKSYNRSPFSSCSSLSFEEDEDSTSNNDSSASVEDDKRAPVSTISSTISTTKLSRCSDLGPSVKCGWTAVIHGAATFQGPTSI